MTLSESFSIHAEKIYKSQSCQVLEFSPATGRYGWVTSYRSGDVKAAINNCVKCAEMYGRK